MCFFFSRSSESIKSTFTVSRYLKKPPPVLKILFQRGTYDMTTVKAMKMKLKLIFLKKKYKKTSSNKKISYTLVSMINHDGDSLDCKQYVSDGFDANTGIWWHCDDENITQICDKPKGVYIRESLEKKNNLISGSTNVIFDVYMRTSYLTKYSSIFFQEFTNMSNINHMKKLIEVIRVRKKLCIKNKKNFLY